MGFALLILAAAFNLATSSSKSPGLDKPDVRKAENATPLLVQTNRQLAPMNPNGMSSYYEKDGLAPADKAQFP